MLEIWAYAFAVMYSPGPVNLLGLYGGLHGKTRQNVGYFAGVGVAMLFLFSIMSLMGGSLVNKSSLPFVSILGCGYILYLAGKLMVARVSLVNHDKETEVLSLRNGVLLQIVNPKAMIATLPIVTIQFPAAGISGYKSLLCSVLLAIAAAGAPASYSVVGSLLGRRIEKTVYFRVLNITMAILLVYVALDIGFNHVFRPWFQ